MAASILSPHAAARMPQEPEQDTVSDSDTVNLMEGADAVLSVSPNTASKPMGLSAYLVPRNGQQLPPSAAKSTPASLETQYTAWDDDSREISHLLSDLNITGFDTPCSLLEAHSLRKTPRSSGEASACSVLPSMSVNRGSTLQTPAPHKVLRDTSNQTWPAGAKSIFQSTPKNSTSLSSRKHRQSAVKEPPIHQCVETVDSDSSSELFWDASLEVLLEETADAILSSSPLSPQKTWQVTEEEWERLEKMLEMSGILLREAEHERDAAKKWANSVHESVRLWVEEQRAANAESLANDKVELKNTRQALDELKLELETATTHHEAVKAKLKAVIQRQANTIRELERKLHENSGNTPALKTPQWSESTTHVQTDGSTRASRVSLTPTGRQMPDNHKDTASSSPSASFNIDPATPTKHDALSHSVPTPMSMSVTPRTQRARTTLMDGGKLVVFRNGTEKETRPDGTCVIRFPNGDIKCTLGGEKTDGIVAYYHAKERTTHIRHKNGIEIFEYPSGQVERSFPDGSKDVRFPDGTKRKMFADGTRETIFADGVCVKEDANGKKEITGKLTEQ